MTTDIHFLANNKKKKSYRNDPSFVYRCENITQALMSEGKRVITSHSSGMSVSQASRVVVFHRPTACLNLRLTLRRLKKKEITVLADFDDLVFDQALSNYSPGVLNRLNPHWIVKRRFRSHRKTLPWFDAITVSTKPLAEHLARIHPDLPVVVQPNCVHFSWLQTGEVIPPAAREKIITYFPGTRSHDRDFALIKAPLSAFLQAHPEVKLHITGHLEFEIDSHPGQVQHCARLPFADYQALVQSSWLNLAPLEQTPFNEAKSALKVIEAGYWGAPTVCSPNADIRRFSNAGAIIAETDEQWRDALERMLDPVEYQAVAGGLRERVMALADVRVQARQFIERWL